MRKFLKIIGIIVAVLIAILVAMGIYGSTLPERGNITTTLTYEGKTVVIRSFNITTKKLEDGTQYEFGKHVVTARNKTFTLDGKPLDFGDGNKIEIVVFEDGEIRVQP